MLRQWVLYVVDCSLANMFIEIPGALMSLLFIWWEITINPTVFLQFY